MRRQFKPAPTRPEDFDAFWLSTRRQLEQIDPRIEDVSTLASPHEPISGRLISFRSLGGSRIRAYFLHWNDERPRPLVVYSHGYGCQCDARWDWARLGLNLIGVDIRGFGESASALPQRSRWGYVLTGIDAPESSVLRQAISDYLQAARVGRMLCGQRISRTLFQGISFSGGLALMAQAISGSADILAIGVPTFGWAEGRNLFVQTGSGAEIGRYLAHRPDHAEDVMLVLRYFDAINFADRVRCPTLLGLGLEDAVVPAKTVYGIANHLAGPVELMEFPVSHSDRPEEQLWQEFEKRWLELALHGIPPGFGRGGTAPDTPGTTLGESSD